MREQLIRKRLERKKIETHLKFSLPTDELELRLGGGIPKGSLILIEGLPGTGKSILAERLMYGFLRNNYSVTFISTEYSFYDFISNMRSLNYSIFDYIINRKLEVYPLFPIFSRLRKEINFLKILLKTKYLFRNDVFILDSLSFFTFRQKITRYDILYMLEWFKKVNASGKVIILTINPSQMEKEVLTILREIADVYLVLKERVIAGVPRKYIIVKRFKRPKNPVSPVIAYRVDPYVGFITEVFGFV